MENPSIQKGLGVVLNINADTPLFRYLFHDLSMRSIEPIDPSDAHVTLIDSYSTRFPIHTERDEEALNDAQNAVVEYLSQLAVKTWSLTPKKAEVGKLDRSRQKIGVYIAQVEALQVIREEVNEIGAKASQGRVRIHSDRPFEPHLTLGSRMLDYYKEGRAFSAGQRKRITVPKRFFVTDYEVSTRTFESACSEIVEPQCQTPRFRNVPAYVRRAV